MKNILLIILVILNIWLGCLGLNSRKLYESQIYNLQERNSFENAEIAKSFINTIRYHQTTFLISDSACNIINRLFVNSPDFKLFYRINFPYCEICIYPVIEKLSTLASKLGVENIIILTSFPSEDYSIDFINFTKDKKVKVINIPDLDFCFNTNDFVGSYLFLLNSKYDHRYLFFVSQYNQFMIHPYIDFLYQELSGIVK